MKNLTNVMLVIHHFLRVGTSLNRHIKTHTRQKPFKCDIFTEKFTRKSGINKDIESIHDFK